MRALPLAPPRLTLAQLLLPVVVAAFFLPLGLSRADASEDAVVKRPAPGCIDKATMRRVGDLREQHDGDAARNLMVDGLGQGECRWFSPGEPVVIEEGDIVAGLSKVHTRGDPQPFWIHYRALETD